MRRTSGRGAAPEPEWLEKAEQVVVTGFSYDKSDLRPGARPHLVWHEYPLVSVWVSPTTGAYECDRTPTVVPDEGPVINLGPQTSVAAALRRAAARIEECAAETDRDRSVPYLRDLLADPQLTEHWRALARQLRERAVRGDLDAIAL